MLTYKSIHVFGICSAIVWLIIIILRGKNQDLMGENIDDVRIAALKGTSVI
jgi:hypothetical protein